MNKYTSQGTYILDITSQEACDILCFTKKSKFVTSEDFAQLNLSTYLDVYLDVSDKLLYKTPYFLHEKISDVKNFEPTTVIPIKEFYQDAVDSITIQIKNKKGRDVTENLLSFFVCLEISNI